MGMTPNQAKQLGAVIAKARAKKGWSIFQLASRIGAPKSWVGFLEQGRYVDPAPERLARIAELLDIEAGRMDRLTQGAVSEGLPELGTYFRAKYDLTPEQIEQVERYVRRLRRQP
jgi:transcriptional regulator with XRE-family HTH domain